MLGEDIGKFGGAFQVTRGLLEQFGEQRVKDTPISEAAIIGAAIGAAIGGMRPVAEIQYADFMTCAMDQIVNQAAKIRLISGGQVTLPLVIRTPLGSTTRGGTTWAKPGSLVHAYTGAESCSALYSLRCQGTLKDSY